MIKVKKKLNNSKTSKFWHVSIVGTFGTISPTGTRSWRKRLKILQLLQTSHPAANTIGKSQTFKIKLTPIIVSKRIPQFQQLKLHIKQVAKSQLIFHFKTDPINLLNFLLLPRLQGASDPAHAGTAADPQPRHTAAGRDQDRGVCRCVRSLPSHELQLSQKLQNVSKAQIFLYFFPFGSTRTTQERAKPPRWSITPSSGHTCASCTWLLTSRWPTRRSAASPATWPARPSTRWLSPTSARGESHARFVLVGLDDMTKKTQNLFFLVFQ